MNLYEIRLEDDIIYNSTLLDAFLFDCKCALFLVDINNPISFDKVKTIISLIDNCNLPYLKKIIVENKSDIKTDKSNEAIEKYISENSKSNIDYIKISLKTEDNLENLLVKIYDEISLKNSEKPIFPIDRVSKCLLKEFPNAPSVRPLSFILIGDSAVGKSNFLSRYIKNAFSLIFLASIRPVISEKKMVLINGKNFYELTIWDTAGQERFRSMPKTYYRNVDGILLLFDINDKSTFEDVNNWMDDVNENIDTAEGEERDVIIYLLGNKIDLKENDDDEDKKEEEKKEEEKKKRKKKKRKKKKKKKKKRKKK
jgi:small GTP-binding protein